MNKRLSVVLVLSLCLLLPVWPVCGAAEDEAVKDWREAAQEQGLNAEDIARLERDGILATNTAYRQVFTEYVTEGLPLFITSDSLLNAYHVLYAESIRQLEMRRAAEMPDIIRHMIEGVEASEIDYRGVPKFAHAARKRALLVLGISLRLLDDDFRFPDAELNALLNEEVERVRKAEGMHKPQWLGPPDPGFLKLDYSRFKPRGFYAEDPLLRRYFQSVAWLQAIPFRPDIDEELLAFCLMPEPNDDLTAWRFFRQFEDYIGVPDDWGLGSLGVGSTAHVRLTREDLDSIREEIRRLLAEVMERPKINDQVALPTEDREATPQLSLRVLPSYRTPCAVLFHMTTNAPRFFDSRDFPEGLEVCAALGSAYARENLTYHDRDSLLETIDAAGLLEREESLYDFYLHAIAALLDEPPAEAPPFMSTLAWRVKSCNTALGGWAQLRHTWALQAKQTVRFASGSMPPPGFVEPDPDFFARMGDLADMTLWLLDYSGVFSGSYAGVIAILEEAQKVLQDVATEEDAKETLRRMSREHRQAEDLLSIARPRERMSRVVPQRQEEESRGVRDRERTELGEVIEKRERFATLIAQLKDEGRGLDEEQRRMIAKYTHELGPLWNRFALLCRRLEALSYKQLFGAPLSSGDRRFFGTYGRALAEIMFHGEEARFTPKDDAPRIVDVYANPNYTPVRYLEVGIARPRRFFVLYPWEGRDLLCVGAILPYYEFTSTERLSDQEWRALLDSDQRPAVPEWARPLYRGGALGQPDAVLGR